MPRAAFMERSSKEDESMSSSSRTEGFLLLDDEG